MTRLPALIASVALAMAGSAPASPKPCRDQNGRVIPCPKPSATPTPRCKDVKGRFVKCGTPGAKPAG